MYPVRSVFERRGRFPCALILLAVCCHAHAGGSPSDGSDAQRLSISPVPESSALAHPGFVAPESAGNESCTEQAACATHSSRISDYLLGFKKYFSKDRLLSRLGFFGYNAAPGTAGHDNRDVRTMPAVEADGLAGGAGRPSGDMLNLNLQPLPQNTTDPRYGWGGFTYVTQASDPLRQRLTTRGVKYALVFEDCLRLEGLYGRSAGLDRIGFGLAQDNWSVSLAGGAGMAVQVGYSIPLGQSSAAAAACNVGLSAGHSFGPNGWPDQ